MYDVVVVGGGIGGTGVAALLAKKGLSVMLVEKNRTVGGRCTSYEREGFKIPTYIHGFSGVDRGSCHSLASEIDEPLSWVKIKEAPFNLQGREFKIPMGAGKDALKALKALNIGWGELLKASGVARDASRSKDKMAKQFDHVDIRTWLSKYTKNKDLLALMAFNTGATFVVPYWEASAGEFLQILQKIASTGYLGYPREECGSIPDHYMLGFEKAGGEYKRGTVKKINAQDKKAQSVELDDGEIIEARVVISNAGIKTTMLDLVDESQLDKEYLEWVNGLKGSMSALAIKVALDKKITDMNGGFYVPTLDSEKYFNQLLEGEMPDEMALWLTMPSNLIPELVPEGKQLICIGSFMPYRPDVDWEPYMEKTLETAIKMFPDIPKHMMWKDQVSPADIARWVARDGVLIEAAQVVGQVGKDRPSMITPIDGLYLVGSDVGSRVVGVEMAAQSAMRCAEQVSARLLEGQG